MAASERKQTVTVSLTDEQVEWLDSHDNRSKALRRLIEAERPDPAGEEPVTDGGEDTEPAPVPGFKRGADV